MPKFQGGHVARNLDGRACHFSNSSTMTLVVVAALGGAACAWLCALRFNIDWSTLDGHSASAQAGAVSWLLQLSGVQQQPPDLLPSFAPVVASTQQEDHIQALLNRSFLFERLPPATKNSVSIRPEARTGTPTK